MAFSAVHFLFDAIASLVALDESDGLLNLNAISRPFESHTKVRNAPTLLILVVCARVIQMLVSMRSLQSIEYTLSNERYGM